MLTTSVFSQRIKAREFFQAAFTHRNVFFLLAPSDIAWQDGISSLPGTLLKSLDFKCEQVFHLNIFLKINFFTLRSTIFTHNFFVAIEERLSSENILTESSEINLKVVAT